MKKRKEKSDFLNRVRTKKLIIAAIFCKIIFIALIFCSFVSSAKPVIKITSPANNIPAGNIKVSAEVTGFNLVDKEGKHKNNNMSEGYIIYYLDVPVPTYYEHPAITERGTYKIDPATSIIWENVTPGQHTFSVQLVNTNNSPLPTPVIDRVTIMVGAPEGEPSLQIKLPEDGAELPPGVVIIAVSVENFIISARDMGVLNREGEGHLIYYIDEDPPLTQNEPAVTETSIVSVDLLHLWKPIPEGEHTFAVQLVNNDDTPMDPAVTAKIVLNIKAAP